MRCQCDWQASVRPADFDGSPDSPECPDAATERSHLPEICGSGEVDAPWPKVTVHRMIQFAAETLRRIESTRLKIRQPTRSLDSNLKVLRTTVVKATELDRDLLARFKVPEESIAANESPLQIEAEIVRAEDRPPFMLRAFVLLPMQSDKQTPQEIQEFVKLPVSFQFRRSFLTHNHI